MKDGRKSKLLIEGRETMSILGWIVFVGLAIAFFACLYQTFIKADGVTGGEIFFGAMILLGIISLIGLGLSKITN